jgi:Fic family protein
MSRKDRKPCEYHVYVPDNLVSRIFSLEGGVSADVVDAESALVRFNTEASSLVNTEALARILLRAESVASSKIEGLVIGARRILRAEVENSINGSTNDVTAIEVLANIQAMIYGIEQMEEGKPITQALILSIHKRLLAGTKLSEYGGKLRQEQNWIGGSDFNPCSADYVPPPWELVEGLMEDLTAFCNTDDLPAVAQAAIAHAQFETIHPFIDGNGRTGRILIQMILRRRGLATRVSPPISLILATWAKDYVSGLTATRYIGNHLSIEAVEGINTWVGRFAAACSRSVIDAMEFEVRAQKIENQWRSLLKNVRKGSSTDLLLQKLVGAPVLTVKSASVLTGKTLVANNIAITRLVEAGILHQVSVGARNRAFEAPEIIDAFSDLERQLASPEGDTRKSKPTRHVPARIKKSMPDHENRAQ